MGGPLHESEGDQSGPGRSVLGSTVGRGDAGGVLHPAVDSAPSRVRDPRPAPAWWAGLLFLLVVGSAWHFLHAATGGSDLVGAVAPVNESVWEHTKLVAIPMLLWAAIVGWRTRRLSSALVGGVAGGVVSTVLMILGYDAYVAVLGHGWFPMDLVLFTVCAVAALGVFERVRRARVPAWLAAVLVAGELAIFAALTFAPPDAALFVPHPR